MLVLVAGRAVQGFGAGAVPATAYATIGRAYPERLRPRVFAILSTAFVVPSLIGPGLASAVSHAAGWRWVFLALVPMSVASGAFALRPLRTLDVSRGGDGPDVAHVRRALRVAVGAGLVIAGLAAGSLPIAAALVLAGIVAGYRSFVGLVPDRTLRAAPRLPAAVLARGILTFAFFGAHAYVPLAITAARGRSTLFASVTVTAASLAWTAGSWVQERMVNRLGTQRFVMVGHTVLLAGIGGAALVL